MTSNHNSQSVQNHSKHIFLIDDDESMRTVLKGMLEFLGFQVHVYASAIEFLKVSMQAAPAVIITDMQMPDMSGVELQAELLKRGRQIPIIFISGESTLPQTISAMKQGAIEFLVKPFEIDELLEAVNNAIRIELKEINLNLLIENLSPREREVYNLLLKGHNNQELIDKLHLSLPTVKQYKSEVMRKLNVKSLSKLIELAK